MRKSKVTIIKKSEINEDLPILKKTAKKRFFRRRKFVDPMTKLVFEAYDNYEDNRKSYYDALSGVFTKKFKDIFEAHKFVHNV